MANNVNLGILDMSQYATTQYVEDIVAGKGNSHNTATVANGILSMNQYSNTQYLTNAIKGNATPIQYSAMVSGGVLNISDLVTKNYVEKAVRVYNTGGYLIMNANELVLERVRTVEEYDIQTSELTGRYTQIQDPSLQTTADGTDVTDALGAPIATFYNNQRGTFGFTNSLFSLDLAASQFGTKKVIASGTSKILVPVSETLEINATDNTVTLSYVPVGTSGAEVSFVKVINANNTFGETYTVDPANATGTKFTINAAQKKITLPSGVTGRVFVNYERESENAVSVTKRTDGVPEEKKLVIHAIFHDPCNTKIKYAGVIVCPRAQIDPSSIDVTLTMEGKHAASYILSKNYCDEDGKLFDIIVSEE